MLYSSLSDLAAYLTRRCNTDIEYARAIFRFVTSVNVDAVLEDLDETPVEGSGMETLLKIQMHMSNHAMLFRDIARYT